MADETTTVTSANPEAPVSDSVSTTPVQDDIAKLEAAIQDLTAAGEILFADEIAALNQKRDVLLEKIKTEAADATNDLITAEQTLAQKYGQAAAHTVEIILLAAILGKLFGVI